MYVCMYVCMYACMHACMHACMYACMYVCMYVYLSGVSLREKVVLKTKLQFTLGMYVVLFFTSTLYKSSSNQVLTRGIPSGADPRNQSRATPSGG